MNKKELSKLKKLKDKYDKAYYVNSRSLVSDKEYDDLVKKIEEFEETKVGSDKSKSFKKGIHKTLMLSLNNTYNSSEVKKWLETIHKDDIMIQHKLDGASLSLRYVKGKLVEALTRGDGIEGDVVTNNALYIKNIPHELNGGLKGCDLVVRGEVVISHDNFKKINKDGKFANPRNLASGTLKNHNTDLISERCLEFIAYRLIEFENDRLSESSQITQLDYNGFKTPRKYIKWYDVNKLRFFEKDIINKIKEFEQDKNNSKYPIDGLVLKCNSRLNQEELGNSNKAPKWAIAYKFEADTLGTELLEVEFSVGRTGTVTPIAIFKPIELNGTVVQRATLHNEDYINKLGDLRIGDTISIEKGGEIIPKVTQILVKGSGKLVKYPKKCPECHSILIKSDGTKIYCEDPIGMCKRQFSQKLAHFGSKNALNIMGLGESICDEIIKLDIYSFVDFLDMDMEKLVCIEGFKERSAFNLYKSIQSIYDRPMEKWLFSLGIPGIGKVMAENLCKKFITWNKFMKCTENQLLEVDGLGEILSNNILTWVSTEENHILVKELKKRGMVKRYNPGQSALSNILNGYNICVTGNFGEHSRESIAKHIRNMGGEFHTSIKKNTTTLLCGEATGKNKILEAQKKNIEILSTNESIKLLQL